MPTTATTYIEIGVNLAGAFPRGYAATHNDPGEPDTVEDVTVEGLLVEQTITKNIDLLDGVAAAGFLLSRNSCQPCRSWPRACWGR